MKCFGYLFVSLDYKLFQTRSHHLVQGCISATNRSLEEDTYADKRFVSNKVHESYTKCPSISLELHKLKFRLLS